MSIFDFFRNLPLLVFIFALVVVFFLFVAGAFFLLTGGRNEEKIEKGRKTLLNSLYSFFIILLSAFVFFSLSYLLRRGEALLPSPVSGEFPPSPDTNFPPPPQFIKIEEYYFLGPYSLDEKSTINKSSLYSILCKKSDNYDIIYIGEVKEGDKEQVLNNPQYKCWRKNCGKKTNLYLAIFPTPSEQYSSKQRVEIKEELKNKINPPCFYSD